jgi:hypothetical protein
MYLDIIKNPIVLGVFAGAITYLYLMWGDKKKSGKQKQDVSLFYPIVVAIVVSVIAYGYFNYSNYGSTVLTGSLPEQTNIKKGLDFAAPTQNYHFVKEVTSESPASFHLISRGVNIPNSINIPDVFIETTY